jgi:hypothetical protein
MDSYGDDLVNIGNIGSNNQSGQYLLSYSPDEWGLFTDDAPEGYVGVIKFPMAYGLATMRVFAERNEEDVLIANELQDGFRISRMPRNQAPIAPRLDLNMFREREYQPGYRNQSLYQATMKLAARMLPYTPPYVIEDREEVEQRLANAGFQEETWRQPPATNLTLAVQMANDTSMAFVSSVSEDMGNDWFLIEEEYFGIYYSNYNMRYFIGMFAYLGLTGDQALYPSFTQQLELAEGEAMVFSFSARPRIATGGFWSFTVYGENQDLIENPLGRYSLGSVDEMTLPDGTPLSDPDAGDSEFQILLQASDMEPPSNWTSK